MMRFSRFVRCCASSLCNSVNFAASWNVTEVKLQAAILEAVQLGFAGNTRIEFLLAKGVPHDIKHTIHHLDGTTTYHSRFSLLAAPPTKKWETRGYTLDGILGTPASEQDAPVIPSELSFDHFVGEHPEWRAGASFVVFRDHPNLHGVSMLIQREQIFGTCAIHAPVVLQHYLVALANKGTMPTVSIPRWIRKHAPSALLEGIIFGEGTNAYQVLNAILLPNSLPQTCLFGGILSVLRTHGPVLLPMWGVTDDFLHSDSWRHIGSTADFVGHHSMIVVGSRVNPNDGTVRVLLQNWWRNKQFIEVDEAYYSSCIAPWHAVYVTTPQPSIPASFDITNAVFSVSTVDGAGVSSAGCGNARCDN